MAVRNAMPPTTPPAIAPALGPLELPVAVGVGGAPEVCWVAAGGLVVALGTLPTIDRP